MPPGRLALSAYPGFTWINCLRGMIIYGSGDTLAALILGEFNVGRLLRWRFVVSALFSASMAVYYALSVRIF